MRINLVLMLCIFLSGCVSFETVSLEDKETPVEQKVTSPQAKKPQEASRPIAKKPQITAPAPSQPQQTPAPKEGLVSKLTAIFQRPETGSKKEAEVETVAEEQKENLTNIHHVTVGMKYGEVMGIMRKQTTVGYQQGSHFFGTFAPVTIENPYRQEVFKAKNRTYDVVYYFTHIRTADGQISDDELTPLVFENDELIGKGWTFLLDMKKQP